MVRGKAPSSVYATGFARPPEAYYVVVEWSEQDVNPFTLGISPALIYYKVL